MKNCEIFGGPVVRCDDHKLCDNNEEDSKRRTFGMDVNVSREAMKQVNPDDIFNKNVVETLTGLGILKQSKTEDASGVHYRWKVEGVLKEKTEFTILSQPVGITLKCPYCKQDISIAWKHVNAPNDWMDDWEPIECPRCKNEIELGNWIYD